MINTLEVASDGYLTSDTGQPLLIAMSGYLGGVAVAVVYFTSRIYASINAGLMMVDISKGETDAAINEGKLLVDINEV